MEFLQKKPIYLIMLVILAFALWNLPKAMQHYEQGQQNPSTQELNQYIELKGQALSTDDSLEIKGFVQTLLTVYKQLKQGGSQECNLHAIAQGTNPRIMDSRLLSHLNSDEFDQNLFDKTVSPLNQNNPFAQLNYSIGDGFTLDLGLKRWHKGLLYYVQNLFAERLLFLASIKSLKAPQYLGERNFIAGLCGVDIYAIDLKQEKTLCKRTIEVRSKDSFGLPLKTKAMNQALYRELMEKTVEEVTTFCRDWMVGK